jgi:ribose 5-phosphate isomerase A
MINQQDEYKRQAAERAVTLLQTGMVVGLGHGSTAIYAVRRLAALLREGVLHDIVGVACSTWVEAEARQLGIPLTTLNEHPVVDLTIDGADEVTPELDVLKGGGGALLREKIVAQASTREIIVVDDSKLVPQLGTRLPIPLEVSPFGWRTHAPMLAALGARAVLRLGADGQPFRSDQGNYILDCHVSPLAQPAALASALQARAGILEHGLFLRMGLEVIVAGSEGVRHLR